MMTKRMKDRMSRRMSERDGRNPYGSRGGYVSSRRSRRDRARNRMRDREMEEYYDEYEHHKDGNYPMHSEHLDYHRPMQIYGVGGVYPYQDYARNRDRGYGMPEYYDRRMDYSSSDMEKEYEEDLHEWIEKLKKYDKYGLSKEQVIQQAKNMGVKFQDFDETEFYAIYLMMLSDYPSVGGDYPIFIHMAKDFLMDKDVALKGSDKVCAYLYDIVLGEED